MKMRREELDAILQKYMDESYELGKAAGRAEALGGEAIKASAYRTDEGFGYDRWKADQYSQGRGTHNALIVILGPRLGQSAESQKKDGSK